MKILAVGLWCTGSVVAARGSPLIVTRSFDDTTSSQLQGLTPGASAHGLAEGSRLRLDVRVSGLPSDGDGRDGLVLGLHCRSLPEKMCGLAGATCYQCSDGAAAGSTATLVAKGTLLSGVLTTPRGYKIEIKTVLPPDAGVGGSAAGVEYAYEAIDKNEWKVEQYFRVAAEAVAEHVPFPGDRALLSEDSDAPAIKSQARQSTTESSPEVRARGLAPAGASDDGSVVTLLYYFSKRAMCDWTDQDYATCQLSAAAQASLESKAAVITTYGNVALANSNVAYVYEQAHVHVDMDHDEGTSGRERLDWIEASPAAAALRDQFHADLVVDVFYRNKSDGTASGKSCVAEKFPDRDCSFSSTGGPLALVESLIHHEVGHNMGLNHNREEFGGGGDPNKSYYGWINCNQCFMTIMSYENHCERQCDGSVTRIPYFSNTDREYANSAGSFPIGDASNDCSATLDLSRMGVAMNRLEAPQLVLDNNDGYTKDADWADFVVFTVIAKADVEVINIEFKISADMKVEVYTANGPWEGNEHEDSFWGATHVSEDISRMNNVNPLIEVDIFQSFPALALAQGSTTSFKITHASKMIYANRGSSDVGDVEFENEHLQVTAGLFGMGSISYTHTEVVTLNGALRYILASASDTDSPIADPTEAPTKAPSGGSKTGKATASPIASSTKVPTKSPTASPIKFPTKAPIASKSKAKAKGKTTKARKIRAVTTGDANIFT